MKNYGINLIGGNYATLGRQKSYLFIFREQKETRALTLGDTYYGKLLTGFWYDNFSK